MAFPSRTPSWRSPRRRANLNLEIVNEVHGIRLDAEIQLGHELIRDGEITHAHKRSLVVVGDDNKIKLSDYGISRDLSARSQFLDKRLLKKHFTQLTALLPGASLGWSRAHFRDQLQFAFTELFRVWYSAVTCPRVFRPPRGVRRSNAPKRTPCFSLALFDSSKLC